MRPCSGQRGPWANRRAVPQNICHVKAWLIGGRWRGRGALGVGHPRRAWAMAPARAGRFTPAAPECGANRHIVRGAAPMSRTIRPDRCVCDLDAATSGGRALFDNEVAAIAALRLMGQGMHAIGGRQPRAWFLALLRRPAARPSPSARCVSGGSYLNRVGRTSVGCGCVCCRAAESALWQRGPLRVSPSRSCRRGKYPAQEFSPSIAS
jgi:hypothetical protein